MDAVSSARTARENLAKGLAALQAPGLPPQIMAVADPVAQAMGALHRIEASGGAALPEAAPAALAFVRQALALLQSQPSNHPAVEQGTAAIAGSLGIVHGLSQMAVPAAPAAPVSPYAGTVPSHAVPAAAPAAAPAYVAPPPPAPAYAPPAAAPAYAPPPAQFAAPAQPPAGGYAAPAGGAAAGVARVEAALGAHSATNFYKGLSGNDVIESGGIFIATYQIPPIGSTLLVHVSLPGGYEFEAQAVVRWTRDAANSIPPGGGGHESPPGFGAQFTHVSQEARQLVYRYVRNREPLFHDDL